MLLRTLLIVSLFVFCGCSHLDKVSKQTFSETRKFNKDPVLQCERQGDYVRVFYFFKNNHFAQSEGPKKRKGQYQKFYAGTYSTHNDTVYMNYHNKIEPDSMRMFLVINQLANYLIYPYKNNVDTLRLRFQGDINKVKNL